jgi:hypothetical protein
LETFSLALLGLSALNSEGKGVILVGDIQVEKGCVARCDIEVIEAG